MNNNWRSLKFLFMPSWWIQIMPSSTKWDAELNQLMDNHQFKVLDEFHAQIGGVTVWIANHPYASFNPANPTIEVLPLRLTRERARKKLIEDASEQGWVPVKSNSQNTNRDKTHKNEIQKKIS